MPTPAAVLNKRMSAQAIWAALPDDVRALSREQIRNWLCFKLRYSYCEPAVNKLADRLIGIRGQVSA